MLARLIIGFWVFFAAPAAHSGAALVVDGDTIELDGVRYRLHGVDAPEHAQSCSAFGEDWACGKAATAFMRRLIDGADTVCAPRGEDRYGRIIATCAVNGRDLGEALTLQGLAWAYTRFSNDYLATEAAARAAGRGIWRAPTETAWDFRKRSWRVAAQAAPEGCPIKGNISANGRIYHPPWSPWYARTKISLARGERWFCDEAEAIAAGWRAPNWR